MGFDGLDDEVRHNKIPPFLSAPLGNGLLDGAIQYRRAPQNREKGSDGEAAERAWTWYSAMPNPCHC